MVATVADEKSYAELREIVKMLLVLSHGQATVERGFFSVDQQIENLAEESFVAKLIIFDNVSYVGVLYTLIRHNGQKDYRRTRN